MMRRVMGCLGLALVGALALLVMVWALQRQLVYFPSSGVPPVGSVLLGAQEISCTTRDGVRLKGWFLPRASDREPGATALVFNGNAGHRAYRAELASTLHAAGFAVMLFDYRGYGDNAGHLSEQGLLEDGRAAIDYLLSRPDVDPASVVLVGESLGAAVALAQAIERPPAGLVLRSPFTSLAEVGKLHYPWLPVSLLLRDRYPSRRRIARLDCPLLVVAGGRDRIVPASMSRALHDAAPVEIKRFVLVSGADHNDPSLGSGETWQSELIDWWAGLPRHAPMEAR